MKHYLQKMAIWLYEKLGCRTMDKDSFWTYHVMYSAPKDIDHKIIIAKLNDHLNEAPVSYVGTVVPRSAS